MLVAHTISMLFPVKKLALMAVLSSFTSVNYPKYWYVWALIDSIILMVHSNENLFLNYLLPGLLGAFIALLF